MSEGKTEEQKTKAESMVPTLVGTPPGGAPLKETFHDNETELCKWCKEERFKAGPCMCSFKPVIRLIAGPVVNDEERKREIKKATPISLVPSPNEVAMKEAAKIALEMLERQVADWNVELQSVATREFKEGNTKFKWRLPLALMEYAAKHRAEPADVILARSVVLFDGLGGVVDWEHRWPNTPVHGVHGPFTAIIVDIKPDPSRFIRLPSEGGIPPSLPRSYKRKIIYDPSKD